MAELFPKIKLKAKVKTNMKNKFMKIYLNEKAISFISEKMLLFGSMGLKISNLISSSKHKIWGLFSSGISDDDLIEFEFGGKFADRPIHEVVEIVKLSLEKNEERCWILIDNNGNVKYSPEKNAIENITTVFFYKDFVLHFLSKRQILNEDIEKTFKFGGAYPFIGFVTNMNSNIEQSILDNSVDDKAMEFLISNITLLIVGAYDEEGYLIVELDN